ncbi:MAG TPA: hypothetical protein PLA85_03155 [Micropepsaceae bacterium]|nr:hypothetical protein [Micropepsaceae bacterium]
MHVLVTGFQPFPGAPENPTEVLMRHLAENPPQGGASFSVRVLPTTFDVFERVLAPAIAELRPDAVVSFGLSAKAQGFTFERLARNEAKQAAPDATGAVAASPWLDPLGPATLGTGLPLPAMAARLDALSLPHALSDDAGAYMCNLVFYKTRRLMPERPTGFIHVPYLAEQRDRLSEEGRIDAGLFALSEDDLLAGARAVLGVF